MLTVSKVKGSKGTQPFLLPLKCVTAAVLPPTMYTKDGTQKEMQQLALCDNTGFCKATSFDISKRDLIKEGSTVVLKNYIPKPDALIITSRTSIFKAPSMKVEQHIIDQAVTFLRPPPPNTTSRRYLKHQVISCEDYSPCGRENHSGIFIVLHFIFRPMWS